MLTCPNCGYKQSSGDKCQKCRSLFSYYGDSQLQERAAHGGVTDGLRVALQSHEPPKSSTEEQKSPSLWRMAYRVMNWATLVILIVVIGLILRKSTPPQVEADSQSAARAEMKFSQAESAVAANQPYELTLERTELNSYLRQNLEIAGNDQSQPAAANSPDSSSMPASQPPTETQTALAGVGQPSVAEVQSSVRDVRVDLDGDIVRAYVVFDFHGKDLSLELDGHLSSADGYIQFQPVAGWLGSLPLPQSALDSAVQRLVSSPENHEKLRLPAGIQSIAVQNSHLIINYQ
jgi:hypothetical protein